MYSALRQYSVFDYTATTFSFLGLATPVFWLALMLQVGVVQIYERTGHRIFPIANLSDVNPGEGIDFALDRAHHLVMPVIVLMVAGPISSIRVVMTGSPVVGSSSSAVITAYHRCPPSGQSDSRSSSWKVSRSRLLHTTL